MMVALGMGLLFLIWLVGLVLMLPNPSQGIV